MMKWRLIEIDRSVYMNILVPVTSPAQRVLGAQKDALERPPVLSQNLAC